MTQYHKPFDKKISRGTGGKRGGKPRDKKLAHMGRETTSTKIAEADKRENARGRGGKELVKLKKAATVNVSVKEGGKIKTVKAKMLRVVESHNPEFVRQNIITRGAVVETDKGKVKITNRVGQDGVVNGILLK